MALTAMALYKYLPRTNCGDCGFPTCMAFAMQVASKQKAATDCPHLSEQSKSALSDAAAPPMKLVQIGATDSAVKIGQETVMFRHEEKFHNAPALAVKIPASLSDDEALKRLAQINAATFVRVGQCLGVRLAAVDLSGLAADKAAARTKALAEKSRIPLVLMTEDATVMAAAVSAIADKKPLIYRATAKNADVFVKLAAETKCPLAVSGETLEQLADLTKATREKGVTDMVLSFDGRRTAQTLREITAARRAGLKKGFRPFGFPCMVDAAHDNPMKETILASTFAAKYAAIVLIQGLDGAELLPILTTIQNVYTDPQVPNTVDAKLYEIGAVTENSPVMFTTNFALTYFSVEGEIERCKIPCYISVIDTGGLGVLNAFAGDKLSPEKVVKALDAQKAADRVKHRKLIIPGLLPGFRAEIEETSVWKQVLIGPENASGIPAFLAENWK